MEPAEDASLEPSIRWLLQSLLASPLIDRPDPWVREAGVDEEMEGLKSEIKGVQEVVSAIKGRSLGNDPLAEALVELKELLYDADDAVDELDYCRLLQLEQGGRQHDLDQTDGHGTQLLQAGRSIENADSPSRGGTVPNPHETDGLGTQPVGKLRSKLWKEFEILEFEQKGAPVRAKCIHCKTELRCPTNQGTGVLRNHLKSKACLNKKFKGSDPRRTTAGATTNPATGTRHDLDQTDGHHGASQADSSIENADVPSTCGTLPDPHQTDGHGTQLLEISRGNAAAQSGSVGKLRSKIWLDFKIIEFDKKGAPVRAKCIHCKTELRCPTTQGTGVLRNHLKSKACLNKKFEGSDPLRTADATKYPAPPLATGNLSSKKRGRDEESACLGTAITNSWNATKNPAPPLATGNLSSKKSGRDEASTCLRTANTNCWNMDDFSKMIRDITLKLHHIREVVIRVLSIPGSDFAASSNHSQGATSHQCRRTSGTLQGRVYGRESEKNTIIKLMKEEKSATGVTVLPILGIAGVGKTTLAQLVYNHPAVRNEFDYMVWLCVSNNFDAMELTKDMLGSVSQETHIGLCNFAKLQEILESHIKSRRVLIILDDVWDGINDYQWNQLLAPFNSDNARGNMIIVTTRKPCVAKRRGTVTPIKLEALKNSDFWLLFKACAFGDVNHEKKESLSDLGQQIAQKLKGNPLAAETAGALLSEHRTVSHWSSILKNEDWKSLTLSGGIMSSLKICYDQLPYHLQQCFSYCSLFPCNYEFLPEELVRIWISQGFVKRNNSSKRLEEIGQDYQADLVNLGFFEQLDKKSSSGFTQISYVMFDLMHDFARVVSRTECATIDGLQCSRMFPTVRHLSIMSHSIYQMKDQTGNIARSEKFEEILRSTVTSVGKLRSLVLIGHYDSFLFQFFQTAFQKAYNLRLLHMSVTPADSGSSVCNLVNPAHLRYLKLENCHAERGALPQVLSKSPHLQVLDVKLDNSVEPQIVPSLERFRYLTRLKMSNMQNVREVSVPSLRELVLLQMPKLKTCSCTSVGGLMSNLRVLEIKDCPALERFDLFQKVHRYETEHNSWLPSLKKLTIFNCPNLHVMIPLPPLATVSKIKGLSSQTLRIKPNSVLGESPCEMTLDDKFLSFHNLRDLKYLEIKDCCNLVSILLRTLGHLISLKSLKIKNCKELLSSDGDVIPSNDGALPSLESLSIKSCGITGEWLSLMLRLAPTLKELDLHDCPRLTQLMIEDTPALMTLMTDPFSASGDYPFPSLDLGRLCIPFELTSSLKKITIWDCPHLLFYGRGERFANLTSLEKLTLRGCPKLLLSSVYNAGQADGRWLLPQSLEELLIDEYSLETLRPCFVDNLTNLRKLEVHSSPRLKSLELDLCSAIGYLRICRCNSLAALEGLRCLVNLKELNIVNSPVLASLATSGEGCQGISWLPNEVLPPTLEDLEIEGCSYELSAQCRSLATDRLRVMIDGHYV